jgi:tmRNA-binding protein
MNSNLHDMQADIQRLVEQQNQIQAQTMQAQQLMQAQQIASLLNQVIIENMVIVLFSVWFWVTNVWVFFVYFRSTNQFC